MNEKLLRLLSNLSNRHYRKKSGLSLVEGLRCCREASLHVSDSILYYFCTEAFASSSTFISLPHIKPIILSDTQFSALSETESPQGVIFIINTPSLTQATSLAHPFTLVLDNVSDPGNMGTILRTAWAIGLDAVWLVKGSCDPFSPKCLRSGMGAQFSLSIHLFDTLTLAVSSARNFGTREVWCTLPGSGISLYDPDFVLANSCLIIGNEANGISDPSIGRAVTIPMPGHAESLNAAQAATVFLVDSLRPR